MGKNLFQIISYIFLMLRGIIKKLYNKNLYIIDLLWGFYQNPSEITYFPGFKKENTEEFCIHYAKASWFFKKNDLIDYRINFFLIDEIAPQKLDFMSSSTTDTIFLRNSASWFYRLIKSKNILLWNKNVNRCSGLFYFILYLLTGKRIYSINLYNLKSIEYGTYAKLPWILLNNKAKKELLHNSKKLFINKVKNLKNRGHDKSYVFGNGPSLGFAYNYDFNDGYKVVANSIVRNQDLISHIQPDIFVAGDPLWHFGPCKYAEYYRNDVENVIKNRKDILFVFPIEQGLVNYINLKNCRNNIVLVPYHGKFPVYNLTRTFKLPSYTSVVNALMLPLACTLTDKIYILGVDGKVKNISQEDFWPHAKSIQYPEELVNSGHLCSPTFDVNRKNHDEVLDVEKAIITNIKIGEKYYNKTFINLSKITTFDILKSRR